MKKPKVAVKSVEETERQLEIWILTFLVLFFLALIATSALRKSEATNELEMGPESRITGMDTSKASRLRAPELGY